MLQCCICKEAFFVDQASRARHQQLCLALADFYSLDQQHQPTSIYGAGLKRKKLSSPPPPPPPPPQGSRSCSATTRPALSSSGGDCLQAVANIASTSSADAVLPSSQPSFLQWRLKKGFDSAKDFIISNVNNHYKDLPPFVSAVMDVVHRLLDEELKSRNGLKFNVVLESVYRHPDTDEEQLFNFKTRSRAIYMETKNLRELLQVDGRKLLAEESDAEGKGSGWSLAEVRTLTLRISKLNYKSKSGSKYIQLPNKIRKRNACVNVNNVDEKCFVYSMLAKFLPHSNYLTEDSFVDLSDKYNFQNLNFPMHVKAIDKFEQQNQNCSINVFGLDESNDVYQIRIAADEKSDHTDLLLIENLDDSHYVWIHDFNRLIRPQLTKLRYNITVCKRCYTFKRNNRCDPQAWLKEHLALCCKFEPVKIVLPEANVNDKLKFTQYEMQNPIMIVVVADFESTLVPTVGSNNTYQIHEANSFCTLVKSTLPQTLLDDFDIDTSPYLYRADDAAKQFLLYLERLAQRVEMLYSRQLPLSPMTFDQITYHERATLCDFCHQTFDSFNNKVLDHCHITGAYRATLCNSCNLRCRTPNFIPVYLHNLSSYDQAFIIKNLSVLPNAQVNIIPSNSEKLISFSVKVGRMWLRFLDSYRLMADSLANLASNLPVSEFIESSKLVSADNFDLIRKKSFYPYDYVTSQEVFQQESLPERNAFYNRLNDTQISEQDYAHVQNVWTSLNMKNFGMYHDFYLTLDVCLLADALQSFRNKCLRDYRIDCCHTFTLPGLAWQSMLRMTGITLDLVTDYDVLLMLESGIRGGIVQCSLHYAKANNHYLELAEDFNADEDLSYLLYLDAINLYGYALSRPLPSGDIRFVKDCDRLNWSTHPDDSPIGYILECDVHVPAHLHDKMNDLPLLPEMLVPPGGKQKKLLTTLHNKHRYVGHYTLLQQAVRLGLQVTKVHRAIQFSQSTWMKKFIDFNANLRAKASDEFSKSFYKFMNNSVFGKTMENVRRRVDMRIATGEDQFQKLLRNTRFVDRTIIADNVVAVELQKRSVKLDKPIYVGMAVLDISKVHMYNFYYNVLQKRFSAPEFNLSLAYLDTDGLILYIKTQQDLNQALHQHLAEYLDRSVYPPGHPLRVENALPVIGNFKDECRGKAILEYVGLRPKMYCYRFTSQDQFDVRKKAKGIKQAFVQKHVTFDEYKRALFENEIYSATFNLIQCKTFTLTSKEVTKKSLSANDDKRHTCDCNVRTLAYGHYKLDQSDSE